MTLTSVVPEDEYRKKMGWEEEWELFQRALDQHQVKHPGSEPNCNVCNVIFLNLCRLTFEEPL